jgi:hypothetical protein
MTDLPYTDADLRAEAARQHHDLTSDTDYQGVGEAIEDTPIPSTGRTWWDALADVDADDYTAYQAAQGKIHDLITGAAADTSGWAVALGADGLVPTGHRIEIAGPDGDTAVRLHFAFDPTMPAGIRDDVVADLMKAIAPVVPLRPVPAGPAPTESAAEKALRKAISNAIEERGRELRNDDEDPINREEWACYDDAARIALGEDDD